MHYLVQSALTRSSAHRELVNRLGYLIKEILLPGNANFPSSNYDRCSINSPFITRGNSCIWISSSRNSRETRREIDLETGPKYVHCLFELRLGRRILVISFKLRAPSILLDLSFRFASFHRRCRGHSKPKGVNYN